MANVTEYIAQGRSFLDDVVNEVKKVHWPTRQETFAFTGVVIIVVTFVAIYLGLVDYLLSILLGVVFRAS